MPRCGTLQDALDKIAELEKRMATMGNASEADMEALQVELDRVGLATTPAPTLNSTPTPVPPLVRF